jgi:hypothetical protein
VKAVSTWRIFPVERSAFIYKTSAKMGNEKKNTCIPKMFVKTKIFHANFAVYEERHTKQRKTLNLLANRWAKIKYKTL